MGGLRASCNERAYKRSRGKSRLVRMTARRVKGHRDLPSTVPEIQAATTSGPEQPRHDRMTRSVSPRSSSMNLAPVQIGCVCGGQRPSPHRCSTHWQSLRRPDCTGDRLPSLHIYRSRPCREIRAHAADRVELRQPGKRWHADRSDDSTAAKVPLRCLRPARAKRRYRRLALTRPGHRRCRCRGRRRGRESATIHRLHRCRWLPGGGPSLRRISGS